MKDWLPVISLVVGGLLTMVTTLFSEAFRNRQVTKKAQEERLMRLTEEGRAFQQQVILELQEELSDLIKLTAQNTRMGPGWDDEGLQQFDEKLLRVRLLKSRVHDDDIRHRATDVSNEAITARDAQDQEEAHRSLDSIWNQSRLFNDQVGAWLRQH